MRDIVAIIGYGLVALFGIFLSADFSGVRFRKDPLPRLLLFTGLVLAAQGLCFCFLGLKLTRWVYPLILHLPLVMFLAVGYKKPWPVAVASVFLAYLCCQIPQWIASATYLFSQDALFHDLLYIFAVSGTYVLLRLYAVSPIQKIMTRSTLSVWMVGLLPLLYYIFDYATAVYTDILYSGNPYVAQLMPSVVSIGYIIFTLIYQSRLEEQEAARQEHFLLSLQLRQSQAEYAALCQVQEQARRFHHDLRHHAALLMDYAERDALPEIKAYLLELQQELDTVPFKKFCGHQVVDLLLSHFDRQAQDVGVLLEVCAEIPATLPFKDTELCSILSNALENAIQACALVADQSKRVVTVYLSVRQRNLLFSVQNPCEGNVIFEDGLPISSRSGHGLGTRSIASIVHQHDGLVNFSVSDGVFLLRVSLPMIE